MNERRIQRSNGFTAVDEPPVALLTERLARFGFGIVARLRNQTDGNAARLIAAASHRHAAPKEGHEWMQYTVIFGTSNKGGLGLAEAPNALEGTAAISASQS